MALKSIKIRKLGIENLEPVLQIQMFNQFRNKKINEIYGAIK